MAITKRTSRKFDQYQEFLWKDLDLGALKQWSKCRGNALAEPRGNNESPELFSSAGAAAASLIKIDRSPFANALAGACTLISTLPPPRRVSG